MRILPKYFNATNAQNYAFSKTNKFWGRGPWDDPPIFLLLARYVPNVAKRSI